MQPFSPPRVVLASSSTWRAELLRAIGLACEIHPPGLDETQCEETRPLERALTLASQKLDLVAPSHPDCLVIAADQVAHLDGVAFGKPADSAEHLAMLGRLRGRRHHLVTGVALSWQGERRLFHDTTEIVFRSDLTDAEISAYVESGEGQGCAGGYQVERLGPWLIAEVNGDWFNVVGLPIPRLVTELRKLGVGLEHVAVPGPPG